MAIVGARKGLLSRGTFNVDVKFEGEWVKFNTLIQEAPILIAFAAMKGQKGFAEEYRDKVKKNIRTGGKRFGYPQISDSYMKKKLSRGGPGTTLTWSETFLESIEIKVNSKNDQWSVGIPKGIKRPSYDNADKNKLQVHEYANILEHGSPPELPARPVFSDTFTQDMGGKVGLRKFIEMAIVMTFGKRGIKVNKI